MTWITVTRLNDVGEKLLGLYGTDGGAVRRSTQPETMDVFNQTGNETQLNSLANNFDSLTLTYDAMSSSVTLVSEARCKCYLWINAVIQPGQDDFNPLGVGDDPVLTGLDAPGVYRVMAVNELTSQSGYIEFEVV